LAAIRRERGNLVPSTAALCFGSDFNAIPLAAGLLAAGLFGATPAAAQTYDPRYPVCIEVYTIDGSAIDCSFTTMAQCAATASGQSTQCYANPYYAMQNCQPGPGPSPPRRSR
jgi:hypothetical protein